MVWLGLVEEIIVLDIFDPRGLLSHGWWQWLFSCFQINRYKINLHCLRTCGLAEWILDKTLILLTTRPRPIKGSLFSLKVTVCPYVRHKTNTRYDTMHDNNDHLLAGASGVTLKSPDLFYLFSDSKNYSPLNSSPPNSPTSSPIVAKRKRKKTCKRPRCISSSSASSLSSTELKVSQWKFGTLCRFFENSKKFYSIYSVSMTF